MAEVEKEYRIAGAMKEGRLRQKLAATSSIAMEHCDSGVVFARHEPPR
jgi:hypothetical protein